MKKIVLLIILVVALIFAGKYVYDKQSGNPISLGGANDTAQVSGSKDMGLTKTVVNGSNALLYTAELMVTNYSKREMTVVFFGMPQLFKMDQTGNYPTPVATSGVRVSGYISDPATTTRHSLNGPLYIRPGETKRFVVNAVFTDMATGTYKAALGAKGVSGYTINGGSLQLLPSMKSRSVDFFSNDVVFKNASSTLINTYSGAGGAVNGLFSHFKVLATPIGSDVMASSVVAHITLVNVATGAVVSSSTIPATAWTPSASLFRIGNTYQLDFAKQYASSTGFPPTGSAYRASLNSITWIDINNTRRTKSLHPNTYLTNVMIY